MKYRFTDIPRYVSREDYAAAINRMVEKVVNSGLAQSVYQVGSVGTPGISDVDLVVILHENLRTDFNPVAGLTYQDRYLFSHRLFGTVIPYALELEKYVFFGNYEHLWGYRFDMNRHSLPEDQLKLLKYQIALEYLLKAWISISINTFTGIIKVRNLLLHAKGILHDIRFLELENTALEKCIHKIIKHRENWFNSPLKGHEIVGLTEEYQNSLEETVRTGIARHGFYIPKGANLQIAKSIRLEPGAELKFTHKGIKVPNLPAIPNQYINKINNRLNQYVITLPLIQQNIPEIIMQRYQYLHEAFRYNKQHLPGFICTGHGIDIFSS